MTHVFHLSLPVRDLEEAIAFYTDTLQATIGRKEQDWADIGIFGAQVTLQNAPHDVLDPMPRTRHFGATLSWQSWQKMIASLEHFVEAPNISYSGTEREQGKAMISDPSGNFVELKAYRNPDRVLPDLGLVQE